MIESSGYLSLKEVVQRDCEGGENCFNPEGCDNVGNKAGRTRCFHRYCDKFRWVVDRAKHYSENTGIPAYQILDRWEQHRDYSYLNYYQEANQPAFGKNLITFKEWERRGTELFGEIRLNWLFRCAVCGHVQSPQDFLVIGADPCAAYYNCIGRYDGAGKRAFGDDLEPGVTCDYTSGGLICMTRLSVFRDDLTTQRVLDFAADVCPTHRSKLDLMDMVLCCTHEECSFSRIATDEEIEAILKKKHQEEVTRRVQEAKDSIYNAVTSYVRDLSNPQLLEEPRLYQEIRHHDYMFIVLKHPEPRYLNSINEMVGDMVNRWDDREDFVEFMESAEMDWDEDVWHDHIYIDCKVCEEGSARREDPNPRCDYCGNLLDEDGNGLDLFDQDEDEPCEEPFRVDH